MGVGADRADPGIDPGLVTPWIEGLGIGASAPLRYTRLGDGKSNLTYLVEDRADARWVLRRPPLGKLLPSAHDVAREYRILSRLAATNVPISRPLALREPDAALDVPLMLMEHVAGVVIDSEAALATVGLDRRHAIGLALARALPLIHEVDLKEVGLEDLAGDKPYAARQLKRWRRQFEDSKTRELPLVESLAARLERSMPEQREVTLVHGDYHLLNVITAPGTGGVNGILDWELSTLGDPLADLGCLLAYWPQADDPIVPTPPALPAQAGFPSRAELVRAYVAASGRDASSVPFWEALGCWKIAIISEGVLRRRLDEPANGDPAMAATATDRMLERTRWIADRAGF